MIFKNTLQLLLPVFIAFCLFPFSLNAQKNVANFNSLCLGQRALNFLVISDMGREGINDKNEKAPGQIKVANQLGITAKEINAAFVVTCGDNFHGQGVTSVTDSLWFVNFENVYTAKSLMIPWYITLGNHDYEGNVDAEIEYSKTSNRWSLPARYYNFTKILPDSSSALFVILDSSPFIDDYNYEKGEKTARQIKWCDSVLNSSNAKWKFAFFHHPAYSASSTHGCTKEIITNFVPLFEKYNVDACFSGHDHDLQHSHPENSTIEYFGVGGGSSPRTAGKESFSKYSFSSLGFGVVSLTSNIFKFSFVNDKGDQLYSYELKK